MNSYLEVALIPKNGILSYLHVKKSPKGPQKILKRGDNLIKKMYDSLV